MSRRILTALALAAVLQLLVAAGGDGIGPGACVLRAAEPAKEEAAPSPAQAPQPAQAPPGERPAASPPEGKVWTNEDLRQLPASGVSYIGVGTPTTPPLPATAERGEHWWRFQYQMLRERLRQYEGARAAAGKQYALAANPFTRPLARDEKGQPADPVKLKQWLDDVTKGIEATNRALAELDSAARKADVPREWQQPPIPTRKEAPAP